MLKWPILVVVRLRNTTIISIEIMRAGWVAAISIEFRKLILEVLHITRSLKAKMRAEAKTMKLIIRSIPSKVENMQPMRYTIENINMEKNARNMDCFIFIFRPSRELTQGWVKAPAMIDPNPNIMTPLVPPSTISSRGPALIGSNRNPTAPIMKLRNIIESREILVEGKLIIYLERPMISFVLDNLILHSFSYLTLEYLIYK